MENKEGPVRIHGDGSDDEHGARPCGEGAGMKPNQVKKAADAMAALYVWDCVVSILEGGTDPGRISAREQREVARVIKIATQAKLRMLDAYDSAVATAVRAAKGE